MISTRRDHRGRRANAARGRLPPRFVVAATHPLFTAGAAERLARLPLARVIVTDALPPPPTPGLTTEIVSLAPLLAEAIRRVREHGTLANLTPFARPR